MAHLPLDGIDVQVYTECTMDIGERLRLASGTERDKAILDAHNAGWSLAQIAAIVELSRSGVRKIILKENPE